MILLAETPALLPPSPSRDDIARSLEAARLTGWRVFEMPPDFSQCDSAENAFAHIATRPTTHSFAVCRKSRRSHSGTAYGSH